MSDSASTRDAAFADQVAQHGHQIPIGDDEVVLPWQTVDGDPAPRPTEETLACSLRFKGFRRMSNTASVLQFQHRPTMQRVAADPAAGFVIAPYVCEGTLVWRSPEHWIERGTRDGEPYEIDRGSVIVLDLGGPLVWGFVQEEVDDTIGDTIRFLAHIAIDQGVTFMAVHASFEGMPLILQGWEIVAHCAAPSVVHMRLATE